MLSVFRNTFAPKRDFATCYFLPIAGGDRNDIMKWIVCQLGAREHYAVARALHRRGELAVLVTDFWVPPGSWLNRMPGMQRLRERWHPDLAEARVLSMNTAMLGFEFLGKLARRTSWAGIMARNAFFQKQALGLLSTFNPQPLVLFSYSYAAGELFRAAKQRSWITVLGQIDPGPEEERIVGEVSRRHGVAFEPAPPEYWNEWRKETELADRVVLNSAWSKDCLVKEGIAEGKMVVVPLAYAAESRGRQDWGTTGPQERGTKRPREEGTKGQPSPAKREEPKHSKMAQRQTGRRGDQLIGDDGTKGPSDQEPETGGKSYPAEFTKERPMRVLFLGQVNVRKGVMELLEAARLLRDEPIEFVIVGRVSAGFALRDVPANVRFAGAVVRSEVDACLRLADVFILPTHSDGFALTQLEAQARKLPVVASKFCGDVVRDGVNGLLLQEISGDQIAQALKRLSADSSRLASLAAGVSMRSCFTLDKVGATLSALTPRAQKGEFKPCE